MLQGKVMIIIPNMVVLLTHCVYQMTQNLATEQDLVQVIFMAQNTRKTFLLVVHTMKMSHALCVGLPIPLHL